MGRDKSNQYRKNLHRQAQERLTGMIAFGESKQEAKRNGTDRDKIFSFNTYRTYRRSIMRFLKYVQHKYPQCTTLKSAKKYVNEWLQTRVDDGLSAWTISMETCALCKFYKIDPDSKNRFQPPERKRADIKRSRGAVARDRHFSETNNAELIAFCRSTGLRRSELQALKGADLMTKAQIEDEINQIEAIPEEQRMPEQVKRLAMLLDTRLFDEQYYVFVKNGKGGRQRLSPIVGRYASQAVERMQNTPPEEKVWWHVSSHADIHHYRAEFCARLYRNYARNPRDIPYDRVSKNGKRYKSDAFYSRGDERKRVLDRQAMIRASKALGHNRISVVSENYLYDL